MTVVNSTIKSFWDVFNADACHVLPTMFMYMIFFYILHIDDYKRMISRTFCRQPLFCKEIINIIMGLKFV